MGSAFISYFVANSPVCFIIIILILVAGVFTFRKPSLFFRLILHPFGIIKNHEYYRLLTADFVHNDFLHLLLNEFMLFSFGLNLEKYLRSRSHYGSLQFLTIYLISSLSGSLATTWIKRSDAYFTCAGASGSIMGCMFSYIILQPDVVAYYFPVIGPVNNVYGGLLFIIAMIVYAKRSRNAMASHEVHFFGAAGGVIATLLMR